MEVFEKLKIEQKLHLIYSPQCNGRIEGFNKFLKATIAKQLETRVIWDDLVWKATAAYNFFPTESSGIAPFFLMFRREAAVKHTLLESENPKYLGTDHAMINVSLMNKLYHVVAHNLNEARKARDGSKKDKTPKEPEELKVGEMYKTFQICENTMKSTTDRTSGTHPGPTITTATTTTSCSTVSIKLTQRPNMEVKTPKHKTLNNALVTMNEGLSTT